MWMEDLGFGVGEIGMDWGGDDWVMVCEYFWK